MACRSSEPIVSPKNRTFITRDLVPVGEKMEIRDSDSTLDHIVPSMSGGGFLFYTVNCIVVGYIMGYRVSRFMIDWTGFVVLRKDDLEFKWRIMFK